MSPSHQTRKTHQRQAKLRQMYKAELAQLAWWVAQDRTNVAEAGPEGGAGEPLWTALKEGNTREGSTTAKDEAGQADAWQALEEREDIQESSPLAQGKPAQEAAGVKQREELRDNSSFCCTISKWHRRIPRHSQTWVTRAEKRLPLVVRRPYLKRSRSLKKAFCKSAGTRKVLWLRPNLRELARPKSHRL